MRASRFQKVRDKLTTGRAPSGPSAGPPPGAPESGPELPSAGGDAHRRIEQRAYERYLQRGGQPGMALEDWLAAEREILQHERRA